MTDIGKFIAAQRTQQGWTQAVLAARLGVRQQTVSRWEKGIARPDPATVERISELLGVPVAVTHRAVDHVERVEEEGVSLPVRPRVAALPVDQLPPDRFEQFCRDFVRALRRTDDVHRYGSQGDTQHGIDLIANVPNGIVEVFQCKRHKQFGPAKVHRAIAETTFPADYYVLLLSRPSASPEARDAVAQHPGWSLWDGEDISARVGQDLDPVAATRLVDTYFPGWREPFLGIQDPGPWLTDDEFYRPLSGGLYSHDLQLVGRDALLDEIMQFVTGGAATVGVVVGRGGIGKTRLLREVARKAKSTGAIDVLFVSSASDVEPAHIERLPRDRPVVVIVDDAHDRSDTRTVLNGILRADLDRKLLIALRPHAVARLRSDLRHVGLRLEDLPRWELDDLEPQDAEDLARAAMGAHANMLVVRRLARSTGDCPLATVIGGRLIQRGELDPNRLEASPDIRAEILSAFRDALVADPTSGDPELRRSALDAVAALQPVRVDDPATRSALKELVGVPFDRVLRELRSLEDGGVLLRRGRSVRIVPDLLGDVILTSASFDDRSRVATGYVDRVMTAADGTAAHHLLVNASRIDWQLSQRQGRTDLSEVVWSRLENEYQSAGIRGRTGLMKLLERVAFYQPRRSLQLVRWAIGNPTSEVEDSDNPLLKAMLRDRPLSHADVLHEIAPVLRNIAYTFEHLGEALDLLWRLAQQDKRAANQYPEHPLRVLKDLAAYERGKPLVYYSAVVDAAERWLDDSASTDAHFSPFDVLEPLLITEGVDRTSNRISITFYPFPLRVEAVIDIRKRVIDLAIREAAKPNLRQTVRALQMVESGLRYPAGLYGRDVTEAEREAWTPIFVDEINRLGSLAERHDLDPVVGVVIRRAVQWHASSKYETRTVAQRIIDSMPVSSERDLAVALYGGWPRLMWGSKPDHAEVARRSDEWLDDLTARLTTEYSDHELVNLLETRIQSHKLAFGQQHSLASHVISVLVTKAPPVGVEICDRIHVHPDSTLTSALSPALSALALSRGVDAIAHARSLLAVDDDLVSRHVAHAFGGGRSMRRNLIEGERTLLYKLTCHQDIQTRLTVARTPQAIHDIDYSYAIDLLTCVDFSDSEAIASEVCMAFTAHGFAEWDDISTAQRNRLFDRLVACPAIHDYHITEFISDRSQTDAHSVVSLLTKRIEKVEEEPSRISYDALPHDWSTPLRFRENPEFPRLLRSIRDWITAKPDSWQRQYLGASLFRAAARNYDTEVTSALRELLASGSTDALETFIALLREAPRSLVLRDVDFVTETLETAARHGLEYQRRVVAALRQATDDHIRSGVIGQPFSEDVDQQERAAKIADQLPRGSQAEAFYRALEQSAIDNIEWQTDADAQLLDGRSW